MKPKTKSLKEESIGDPLGYIQVDEKAYYLMTKALPIAQERIKELSALLEKGQVAENLKLIDTIVKLKETVLYYRKDRDFWADETIKRDKIINKLKAESAHKDRMIDSLATNCEAFDMKDLKPRGLTWLTKEEWIIAVNEGAKE